MGGVELWVARKKFLVKNVMDGVQSSPVTDSPVVPSKVLVLIKPYLHYFSWVEISRL
jgi:hypothetical protein